VEAGATAEAMKMRLPTMTSSSARAKVLLAFFLGGLAAASINVVPLADVYLRRTKHAPLCGPIFAAGLAVALALTTRRKWIQLRVSATRCIIAAFIIAWVCEMAPVLLFVGSIGVGFLLEAVVPDRWLIAASHFVHSLGLFRQALITLELLLCGALILALAMFVLSNDCVKEGVRGLVAAPVTAVCGALLFALAAGAMSPGIDYFARQVLLARLAILLGGGLLAMACGNWLWHAAEEVSHETAT
jgi:hypothetical protein